MGRSNMTALASQNIVALCDVDWDYADKGFDGLTTQSANMQKRLAEAPPEMRARLEAQISNAKLLVGEGAARRSATSTTARCSRSRRTSTASSSPRPITRTR